MINISFYIFFQLEICLGIFYMLLYIYIYIYKKTDFPIAVVTVLQFFLQLMDMLVASIFINNY